MQITPPPVTELNRGDVIRRDDGFDVVVRVVDETAEAYRFIPHGSSDYDHEERTFSTGAVSGDMVVGHVEMTGADWDAVVDEYRQSYTTDFGEY